MQLKTTSAGCAAAAALLEAATSGCKGRPAPAPALVDRRDGGAPTLPGFGHVISCASSSAPCALQGKEHGFKGGSFVARGVRHAASKSIFLSLLPKLPSSACAPTWPTSIENKAMLSNGFPPLAQHIGRDTSIPKPTPGRCCCCSCLGPPPPGASALPAYQAAGPPAVHRQLPQANGVTRSNAGAAGSVQQRSSAVQQCSKRRRTSAAAQLVGHGIARCAFELQKHGKLNH